MTTAQLRYRQAGARGDLAALLAPYRITLPTSSNTIPEGTQR